MSDRLPYSPLSPDAIRSAARQRYPLAEPTQGERQFFAANPQVAGYAAPPTAVQPKRVVVLNPSSPPAWGPTVHANEGIRHWLWESGTQPQFEVTPTQKVLMGGYQNKAYSQNPDAAKQTIVARLLTADPSLSPYTAEQRAEGQRIAYSLLQGLRK